MIGFTKKYLVQYGPYNDGMVVEAATEEQAVRLTTEANYFNLRNLDYDFKVFEIAEKGNIYKVDKELKVRKK